jgi:hypothetical protein
MVTHLWYITKFLQVSAGVSFAVGTTMLLAPRDYPTTETGRPRLTIDRKEVRALPVTLPQGRLYCVKGVVMHQRMYPRGFEQVSSSDAVEIVASVAEEACTRSLRTPECKAAQADLTALRRALRSCHV